MHHYFVGYFPARAGASAVWDLVRFTADPRVGIGAVAEMYLNVVTELSEASEEFACAWADRNLSQHTHGPKRFHHYAIGTITLNYETLHLPADPGLSLILYTAAAGSPEEAKLRELVRI